MCLNGINVLNFTVPSRDLFVSDQLKIDVFLVKFISNASFYATCMNLKTSILVSQFCCVGYLFTWRHTVPYSITVFKGGIFL